MCNNRVNFSIMLCGHCGLAMVLLHLNLSLGPKLSVQLLSGALTEGTENSDHHTWNFRSFFLQGTHVLSAYASLTKRTDKILSKLTGWRHIILHGGTGWVNSNIVYHKEPGQGLTVLLVPSGLPPPISPLPSTPSTTALLSVGELWAELSY